LGSIGEYWVLGEVGEDGRLGENGGFEGVWVVLASIGYWVRLGRMGD